MSKSDPKPPNATAALQMLVDGNQRFATGARRAVSAADLETMRARNASGQSPFAAVLTCADSRVAPEIVFDELLGALFVIREGGNVGESSSTLGSLELAVLELHVPLLVVMGHVSCAAVAAAQGPETPPGHLGEIVRAIRPRVKGIEDSKTAIRANIAGTCQALVEQSPVLAEASKRGVVQIAAALYDPATGQVDFKPLD
ncbi:MAG TPA: carbonic anhydrase [Deltaproteobacteria bacterium]|nr:carbonic anhydrase [Deltaproteobacteria bacterium]